MKLTVEWGWHCLESMKLKRNQWNVFSLNNRQKIDCRNEWFPNLQNKYLAFTLEARNGEQLNTI